MNTKLLTLTAGMMTLAGCSEIEQPEVQTEETAVQAIDESAELAEPVAQAIPERPENAITCNWPAQAGDTAQDIEALYGDDASVEMIAGPEGSEFPGVVLWGDDPARRIELMFATEARTQIVDVRVFSGSQWQIAGLSTGSTLAQATAANGKPFSLLGFEWDYGGMVYDLKGGALADVDGCRAFMSFGPSAETQLPDGLLGDVELMSDDDLIPAEGVTIWQLGLNYPEG